MFSTKAGFQDLLGAAFEGAIQITECDDDLFADPKGREFVPGVTAALERDSGARIYARAATPADAVRTLHEVVGLRQPAPERIETIVRVVGVRRRPIELPGPGALF